MTEPSSTAHPPVHDHLHGHAHGHGHAHAAPARVPVGRARAEVEAEPVSWLMHSGAQRLLAALLVIAAVFAVMAWAIAARS